MKPKAHVKPYYPKESLFLNKYCFTLPGLFFQYLRKWISIHPFIAFPTDPGPDTRSFGRLFFPLFTYIYKYMYFIFFHWRVQEE